MAQQIQQRNDTAANWTLANPILAMGEMGIERDTNLFKIGDGVTAWNSLSYKPLRNVDEIDVAVMENQSVPTTPATNYLNFFAKDIAGRMMLRMQGPSGMVTPLQPSFFQNYIGMINTNTTTSITSIGFALTSVGTISHPTVVEAFGYMTNFASAATANITAGTSASTTMMLRGVSGRGGFFFNARLMFPDASYNESGASTGSRVYVGMTSGVMATTVASDNPAGHHAGFQRLHVNGAGQDTNFFFVTKDGTTLNRVDTGIAFNVSKIYDFFIFCAPSANEIGWRIDNVTDGTTVAGSVSANLPDGSTLLRPGFQIQTINAVSRNVRMSKVYVESDL